MGSDQGLKYVYVLDAKNKVQYRRVSTGALEEDGLRVITEGLKPERMGGRRRLAASSPAAGDQAGADADALYGQAERRRRKQAGRPRRAGAKPRPATGSKPKR